MYFFFKLGAIGHKFSNIEIWLYCYAISVWDLLDADLIEWQMFKNHIFMCIGALSFWDCKSNGLCAILF